MTSPDPYAPGTVGQPNDQITARLRQLEQTVAELMRRDLSNANVGQGGRLRALYGNGNEAFQTGKDPADGQNKTRISYSGGGLAISIGPGSAAYGSQETLVVKDLVGNTVFGTDELAGFGLSHPGINYPMGTNFEGTPSASLASGVEVPAASGGFLYYHPVLWVQCLVTTSLSWKARLRLYDQVAGAEVATSSTTPVQSGSQYFERMLQIPQAYVGRQNMLAEVRLTPQAAGSVQLWPKQCSGTTLSYYDIRPDIH